MSDITDEIPIHFNRGEELMYGDLHDILGRIDKTQHKNKLALYSTLVQKLYPKYPFLNLPPTIKRKKKKETVEGEDAVNQIYEEFSRRANDMTPQEKMI